MLVFRSAKCSYAQPYPQIKVGGGQPMHATTPCKQSTVASSTTHRRQSTSSEQPAIDAAEPVIFAAQLREMTYQNPPVSVVIRYRRPLVSPPRHLSYYLLVLVATRRPVWPSSFLVCLSCPRILFCLGSLALTLPAVQSVGLHLYLAHISYSS